MDRTKRSLDEQRSAAGGEPAERESEAFESDIRSPPDLGVGKGRVMNGELSPGTYRARNGDLIHCRDDFMGRSQIEVEHRDGSLTMADLTVLRDATRVSDDPDWPLSQARFVGVLHFD